MATSQSKATKEVLLKECELCTSDANHLEQMLWTTAGIMFTASVAGIGVMAGSMPDPSNTSSFILRIVIAVLSIAFIRLWGLMSARWYAIQKIMYYRIVEIERELGMYKESYVLVLDQLKRGTKPKNEDQRTKTVIEIMLKQHKPSIVRKTVDRLSLVLTVTWICFLLLQIAQAFKWI